MLPPQKISGAFARVDFTGYPSNHFPGCRLNGRQNQMICQKFWGEAWPPRPPLNPRAPTALHISPPLAHWRVSCSFNFKLIHLHHQRGNNMELLDLMTVVVKLVLSSVNQSHGSTQQPGKYFLDCRVSSPKFQNKQYKE